MESVDESFKGISELRNFRISVEDHVIPSEAYSPSRGISGVNHEIPPLPAEYGGSVGMTTVLSTEITKFCNSEPPPFLLLITGLTHLEKIA